MLDSGTSICGLRLPTFTILVDHFPECSEATPANIDFKTPKVADEVELLILFIVLLALHISIHGSTRTLVIPFAVANIKYNNFGSPFI